MNNDNIFNFIYYILVLAVTTLLSIGNLTAQECPDYNRLINEGDSALKKKDYEWAINRYIVAIRHCNMKAEDTQRKIVQVFEEINDLKNQAEENARIAVEARKQLEMEKAVALDAKKEAIRAANEAKNQKELAIIAEEEAKVARDSTKTAFSQLSILKLRTDSILDVKGRITDALYFHEDSLTLGINRQNDGLYYGFMDRDGIFKIEHKYPYALMFDRTGYAKVERDGNNYLLDISGNEYPVVYDTKNLTSNITALDLRNKQITKFPPEIFKHPQLKIILLSNNPLKNIPFKVEDKLDLITLDIDEGVESLAEESSSTSANNSVSVGAPKRAKIIQTPTVYYKPTGEKTVGIKVKSPAYGGRNDWVVSSDRDNNIVYKTPNGIPNGKTINFMDNFYVIGETDTYLQLIGYDPTVASSGTSRKVDMKKAEYYGWVAKEQLLLWRYSLVNPQNNFVIKGLVVHNVSRLAQGVDGEQQLVLYDSPTLENTLRNENDIRLFEFLYIYDRKNGNYLVGLSQNLPRSTMATQRVIKGWISGKNLQLWAGRLCIEPNSSPNAAAERRAKNIRATIFNSYEAAKEYKSGHPAQRNKILWEDDKYEQGYPPSQKRMPMLGEAENNIYKTAVITDVYNKNNNVVLSAEDHARIDVEYNAIRDKKQNINMLFVIDGTESNHPFFVPIIGAIKSNLNFLEKNNKKYKIATFIYGKSGEGILARQPLTSNHSAVIQTLENYRNKQNLSKDNDSPTDMYEGINTAIRTLDSKETNIIILIGDAGNKLSTNSLNIIQKMKEKECGIISYQTHNVSGRSGRIYDEFIDQTKELIEKSSVRGNLRPKLHYIDEGNTFRLRYPKETTLPGSLTYSDKGRIMSQSELSEEIREMIKSFEEQHTRMLRDLDCKIYVDCKPDINEAVLEYMLKEIPEIDINKIRDMDYMLFAEGYAPIQVDKLEYPLFKFVLFLSDRELYELERTMKRLVSYGNSPNELRENIITVYKEIITIHYGTDAFTVSKMKLGQAIEAVTELSSRSDLLNKYTLKDLEDRRKVSDDEILDINDYMEDKLIDLQGIIGNPKYFFRSRDNTYYWVPQEFIP